MTWCLCKLERLERLERVVTAARLGLNLVVRVKGENAVGGTSSEGGVLVTTAGVESCSDAWSCTQCNVDR